MANSIGSFFTEKIINTSELDLRPLSHDDSPIYCTVLTLHCPILNFWDTATKSCFFSVRFSPYSSFPVHRFLGGAVAFDYYNGESVFANWLFQFLNYEKWLFWNHCNWRDLDPVFGNLRPISDLHGSNPTLMGDSRESCYITHFRISLKWILTDVVMTVKWAWWMKHAFTVNPETNTCKSDLFRLLQVTICSNSFL